MIFLLGLQLVFILALMTLGGYVHNVGASLACPDWPLCYGQIMPPMEGGILFEHGHRMLGALVGFNSIVILFGFWRNRGIKDSLTKIAMLSLGLVIFQGILGGLTVIYRLPTLISTAHLATSLVFLGIVFYQFWKLLSEEKEAKSLIRPNGTLFIWARLCLGILFVQIVWGAFMRHLGLGAVCGVGAGNAILCQTLGQDVNLWPAALEQQIHIIHRYLGYFIAVFFLFFQGLLLRYWWRTRHRAALFLSLGIFLMTGLQVLLGIATVAGGLRSGVTTLHLTGAAVLYLLVLWACFMFSKTEHQNDTASWRDYLSLTKPRLSCLVLFTSGIGIYLAPGALPWYSVTLTLVSTAALVAGACIINCYWERKTDAKMLRTSTRPLPAGRMAPEKALFFGLALLLSSSAVLAIATNFLTFALGITATILYTLFYTPLKRRTPYSLFVGAIPGAIPPLMGWAAVTNSLDPVAWLLFTILFVWQLPHFLAIAVLYAQEYKVAGLKIFPVTLGIPGTQQLMSLYSVVLLFVGILPFLWGYKGPIYLIPVMAIGLGLFVYCLKGKNYLSNAALLKQWARRYFFGTLIYLPLQLTCLLLIP